MAIPSILKEALPYLEEVITGLLMVKGKIEVEDEELKDLVDIPLDEGILYWVNSTDNEEEKIGVFIDKKDVALIGGKIIGMEQEELTDELKDAFNEFMNQFWGRLRLELTKYDEAYNFTQPESEELSKEDLILKDFSSFFPLKVHIEDSEHTFYFLLSDPIINRFNSMEKAQQPDKETPTEVITKQEEEGKDLVKVSGEKLDLILDIELPVAVSLGKARMKIKDVLKLGPGSLIELDRSADDYVDLVVNGKVIARGEVVVVESNFALRIREIVSRAERIKGLRR